MNKGKKMYDVAARMFPICRSLTGNGFRKSLNILKESVPEIQIHEVPTGTQVFDWTVPNEWNCVGGGIYKLNGEKIIDFQDSNLHILGYSTSIDRIISKEELLEHIYTQPEQPDWIPYVTSYYKERWGFCMSENQKKTLTEPEYHVVIKSTLEPGSLTYGDLLIPGETGDEILFSTYLCHPSMANNELSGPVVQTEIINYIKGMSKRRYSYRFVFCPETIGSITYLSRNLDVMKKNIKAGFVLSCVGDDRTYSMIMSKYENTLADRVLHNVLRYHYPQYKKYSFLKRGSDERQYCSVDLPVVGFCRSKYAEYPEYHTSADNMDLISPAGLQGAYDVMVKVVNTLENNYFYKIKCHAEPQLGKRGLYPSVSHKGEYDAVTSLVNFIAYADGKNDLIGISDIIGVPTAELITIKDTLLSNGILDYVK